MALAMASGLASFDQSAGEFLDLSNELAEIIRRDNTAFISRVGISGQATETSHHWMEDILNPNTATATNDAGGTLDVTRTTLTVTAGHGIRFRTGTLFRDAARGRTEVMQTISVTGNSLVLVRGYGGTVAETHAAGFSIQIIAHAAQESQDAPLDESRTRTRVTNFTQIFQRGIQISHTMRSVLQAGVADEFTFQISRRLMEIERELDSSVILGIRSGSAGSDTVYRSMGGLIQFASQAGGNIGSVAQDLTPTTINTMVKQIWDDGGTPNFILVSGRQKQRISSFDQANRRNTFDSTVAGYIVDKFMSDLGFMLDVIVDPWMPDDTVIVGDLSKVRILPLINDAMRAEELAKTGRTWRAQVTGQYTCEIRNAREAFAFQNNLS